MGAITVSYVCELQHLSQSSVSISDIPVVCLELTLAPMNLVGILLHCPTLTYSWGADLGI